jgi:hypothetical protein
MAPRRGHHHFHPGAEAFPRGQHAARLRCWLESMEGIVNLLPVNMSI